MVKSKKKIRSKTNPFVRIRQERKKLILEPVRLLSYPARSYTDKEVEEFLELDKKESKELRKKKLL